MKKYKAYIITNGKTFYILNGGGRGMGIYLRNAIVNRIR